MKSLLFLDNDNKDTTKKDSDYCKNMLEGFGKLSSSYVDSMVLIENFGQEDRNAMYEKIFSNKYIIVTYSMYTVTHGNSLGQIIRFLRAASVSKIEGIIYFDMSGNFCESLGNHLSMDVKEVLHILNGVENNFIITFEDGKFYRVNVDTQGDYYRQGYPFKKTIIKSLPKILTPCTP